MDEKKHNGFAYFFDYKNNLVQNILHISSLKKQPGIPQKKKKYLVENILQKIKITIV
jgi:hypothetical protein